jgi:gliding motility-associated-like protein
MRNNYYILIFLSLMAVCSYSQYLKNPSLEGEHISAPPHEWEACNAWSDPDILSMYTSLDTALLPLFPTDSLCFILLRTRGINYIGTPHLKETCEYIYQELIKPLEKNTCFELSVDLSFSPLDSYVPDEYEPNIAYPVKLQIWGANSPCDMTHLLCESIPIENTQWEKYTFYFNTPDTDYTYLYITSMWDLKTIKPEMYNGTIFVDNLTLRSLGTGDTLRNMDVYFHGDEQQSLTASEGKSYEWTPSECLSDSRSQSPLLLCYANSFIVKIITDENTCPNYEVFNMIFDCDSLNPSSGSFNKNIYYQHDSAIVLNASKGILFDWNPKINLSEYDIQSPVLTGYHPSYVVTITDHYNCIHQETFNILIDCDILFPEKNLVVLDTILESDLSIELVPLYGYVSKEWNPTRHLSCKECQTPIAQPVNSIEYSVELTDEFSCIHNEIFKIKIRLRVPNVITPNDDGYNDCFVIDGLPESSSLLIFDKTGKIVYSADPYTNENCWKGTDDSGRLLEADTYWYAIDNPKVGKLATGFVFLKR